MLVLLDRDGVINRDAPEGILRVEDFHIFPQALEAIAALSQAGFHVAICTNQSAVGRGRMTQKTLDAIHRKLHEAAHAAGGKIDAIYAATEAPEHATHRRKPNPGMLQEALTQFGANPADTFMVGDMLRDLEAAHSAGCKKILVRTGKGAETEAKSIPAHLQPVIVVEHLLEASHHIRACALS
ncbi:MAG: HAD-IIIA family hydrolase [Alphaproteobacteria bacterium]|nr:HAD-IIIA family hydrolase [Alphaproteobacteria bacterium]